MTDTLMGYAGRLRFVSDPQPLAIVHAAEEWQTGEDAWEWRVLCRVNERGKADGGDRGVTVSSDETLVTCQRCRAALAKARG